MFLQFIKMLAKVFGLLLIGFIIFIISIESYYYFTKSKESALSFAIEKRNAYCLQNSIDCDKLVFMPDANITDIGSGYYFAWKNPMTGERIAVMIGYIPHSSEVFYSKL